MIRATVITEHEIESKTVVLPEMDESDVDNFLPKRSLRFVRDLPRRIVLDLCSKSVEFLLVRSRENVLDLVNDCSVFWIELADLGFDTIRNDLTFRTFLLRIGHRNEPCENEQNYNEKPHPFLLSYAFHAWTTYFIILTTKSQAL